MKFDTIENIYKAIDAISVDDIQLMAKRLFAQENQSSLVFELSDERQDD